jgi:hypothetical protein
LLWNRRRLEGRIGEAILLWRLWSESRLLGTWESGLLRLLERRRLLRLRETSLLRLLERSRLLLLLYKNGRLRLQSRRQYGIDATRWWALSLEASIACLLRRKRGLVRGSRIGEWTTYSISIKVWLLKLETAKLLLLLRLESSRLRLKPSLLHL